MKRYFIFSINYYYPKGGMGDFYKDFDTIDEAINACENELNLKPDKLKAIVEDCSYDAKIWDMKENKEIWNIYDLFDIKK